MVTTTEIHDLIAAALPDAQIEVVDPMQDGAHFQALVASQQLVGLSLLKQHKLVMEPLRPVLKERLHALQLKTMTAADFKNTRR